MYHDGLVFQATPDTCAPKTDTETGIERDRVVHVSLSSARVPGQPKVNENVVMPESRNSISKV